MGSSSTDKALHHTSLDTDSFPLSYYCFSIENENGVAWKISFVESEILSATFLCGACVFAQKIEIYLKMACVCRAIEIWSVSFVCLRLSSLAFSFY